jgi:hypothetical protein
VRTDTGYERRRIVPAVLGVERLLTGLCKLQALGHYLVHLLRGGDKTNGIHLSPPVTVGFDSDSSEKFFHGWIGAHHRGC